MDFTKRHLFVLGIMDWFVQIVLFVLALVHPWIVQRGFASRLFTYPFVLSLPWGIWRMCCFDPAINNDIPGLGYWAVGVQCGFIALLLYGVRLFFTRGKHAGTQK